MTEVLAPAGGREQLIAAVRAGADAVYLGLKEYSARAGAENFTPEELCDAVAYCHARNVRVHVAINTLISDGELSGIAKQIEHIARSGADAVIVQDLAVADLVRRMCPELAMHASTQMTIYNTNGAERAAQLGFSRAVLARELELSEIRAIAGASPLETEVFVHGALCMCISGACYLSSVIGGRSGNRGRCAQPCRLNFRLGAKEYALSLKDMTAVKYVEGLKQAGVSSFKIEGRMKRPEYVACAVKAVRDAVDGREPDMKTLQNVFSRSGFTDGYLTGRRNSSMFGIRTEEDIKKSAAALGTAREIYRRERQSVPIDMSFYLDEKDVTLEISDGKNTALAHACSERAENIGMDSAAAERNLRKLGDTPFYLKNLKCGIRPGFTVRASELNALRRKAASELMQLREQSQPKKCRAYEPATAENRIHPAKPSLRIRAAKAEQAEKIECSELILPLREVLKAPQLVKKYGERLLCELPAVMFEKDVRAVKQDLLMLKEMGVASVIAENIGAVDIGFSMGFDVHGGSGLNILNSLALEQYRRMGLKSATLSFEMSAARINEAGGQMRRGIIGYGYLPLMRMRACPARGKNGCGDCTGTNRLTDRKNTAFTLLCSDRKYTTLLNSVPLYVGDRLPDNIDFSTLYFTTETPQEARQAAEAYEKGEPFLKERTKGLYFRELE